MRTTPLPEPGSQPDEPSDEQLSEWASEGRVLVTLLLWCGMLRELDCIPQLLDLTAESGLRAGLVITAETVEQGGDEALSLLAVPPDRGGVLGRLELVLGSTGRGVAAESHLPPGVLAAHLRDAVAALADRLPAPLRPRGWWPLLDAPLVRHAELPVGRAGGRPVVRDRPRSAGDGSAPGAPDGPSRRDLRALAGTALRATRAASLLEERRPYDGCRPGALDEGVVDAVRGAGLEYMWSKTTFGTPRAVPREDGFVVLPFTAGRWDGWSPFYTAGHVRDLRHAEKRLRRHGAAGWLATTVDSPLFALSGEVWQHGARLYDMVSEVVAGGASGELVNVTPNVVARYARLLADRTA